MHCNLGSATRSQLAFPGERNPNFPWEKIQWDSTVAVKTSVCGVLVFTWIQLQQPHEHAALSSPISVVSRFTVFLV